MMTKRSDSALRAYRARKEEAGMSRVELWARARDRALLRQAAKVLLGEGPQAERLRVTLSRFVIDEQRPPKSLFQQLRESPLVGADLDLRREEVQSREVEF